MEQSILCRSHDIHGFFTNDRTINFIYVVYFYSFTYDHRTLKIRLPVRSAIYKQCTGGLVVRWVTTSESPLLYVFDYLFFCVVGCVIVVVRLIGYDLRIMNQAIEANVPDLNF